MFVVTVHFVVKPEHIAAFREAVLAQAHNSLEQEVDCHRFDVCSDPEDERQVFLYEIYTAADSFQAHLRTPHFQAFDMQVRDWLTSKTVKTWNLH